MFGVTVPSHIVEVRRSGILKGRITAINPCIIDSRLAFVCGFCWSRGTGNAILAQQAMDGITCRN